MKRKLLPVFSILFCVLCLSSCIKKAPRDNPGWKDEIVYHVVQRSFYDSNGDRHGDLRGFTEKLDYLKELGVTAILFLPLYESGFYHNYFPTDYEKIDPEFGTMDDYIAFVKAVHAHGMKFIMDMETQYAQEGNNWFKEALKDPASPYADYFYAPSLEPYRDTTKPRFNLRGYDGFTAGILMLNLNNPGLRKFMKDFYARWVDPNKDGNFDDGVDGFRIDHIMDNLDNLGVYTNLYAEFWKPIFDTCRMIHPDLFIVGEQANWADYGEDMLMRSGADACFGIPLRFAMSGAPTVYMGGTGESIWRNELDVKNIASAVEETLKRIPEGKYSLTFIENHDVERWASAMNGHEGKIRCGAVLNLLLPGIPSIYYGQELGVTGQVGNWGGDGNHIPVREAFPWTSDAEDAGIAVFYRNTGPWWDSSYFQTGSAQKFALSVEKNDPSSLWKFYRSLISLRKKNKVFMYGDYQSIPIGENIYCFAREYNKQRTVVILNLSEEKKTIDMNIPGAVDYRTLAGKHLPADSDRLTLNGYDFTVLIN